MLLSVTHGPDIVCTTAGNPHAYPTGTILAPFYLKVTKAQGVKKLALSPTARKCQNQDLHLGPCWPRTSTQQAIVLSLVGLSIPLRVCSSGPGAKAVAQVQQAVFTDGAVGVCFPTHATHTAGLSAGSAWPELGSWVVRSGEGT